MYSPHSIEWNIKLNMLFASEHERPWFHYVLTFRGRHPGGSNSQYLGCKTNHSRTQDFWMWWGLSQRSTVVKNNTDAKKVKSGIWQEKVLVCSVLLDAFRRFQAPLSMEFSRQEYWGGLLFPSPGDLPDSRIEPVSLAAPVLASRFFTTAPPRKPHHP